MGPARGASSVDVVMMTAGGGSVKSGVVQAVLGDLAVTLAEGGECVSDLKVLHDQPGLFGQVASQPTAWRVLDSIDENILAYLHPRGVPTSSTASDLRQRGAVAMSRRARSRRR